MENEAKEAKARIDADNLLALLIKHQPGLINSPSLSPVDAKKVAEFISALRQALIRDALSGG